LAVGAWIAAMARSQGGLLALLRQARIVGAVTALTIFVLYWRLVGLSLDQIPTATFGLTLISVLFGAILILTIADPHTKLIRMLEHGWLRAWGKYSYA